MEYQFLSALEAEIESLEEQLASDIRFKRLQELKRLLPLFRPAVSSSIVKDEQLYIQRSRDQHGKDMLYYSFYLIEVIITLMSKQPDDSAVSVNEIVRHLKQLKTEFSGQSPTWLVRSLLQRHDSFELVGMARWRLRKAVCKIKPVL